MKIEITQFSDGFRLNTTLGIWYNLVLYTHFISKSYGASFFFCTELFICIHRRKLAKQRKKEKNSRSVESLSTKEKNKKHKDKDRPVPSMVSGNHSDDERG